MNSECGELNSRSVSGTRTRLGSARRAFGAMGARDSLDDVRDDDDSRSASRSPSPAHSHSDSDTQLFGNTTYFQ